MLPELRHHPVRLGVDLLRRELLVDGAHHAGDARPSPPDHRTIMVPKRDPGARESKDPKRGVTGTGRREYDHRVILTGTTTNPMKEQRRVYNL